jgi:hypothetical protein
LGNKLVKIPEGSKIPFRNGIPDFSAFKYGQPLQVRGMNGRHLNDMPKIWQEIARQRGLPNPTAAKNWLKDNDLTPHHHWGEEVHLVPKNLNKKIGHSGGAWQLRNTPQ